MYVRWVIRNHKNDIVANLSFHDAYLVESYRNAQGNPRQRTLCYLGNLRQIDGLFPAIERELFLMRAEQMVRSTPGLEHIVLAEVLDLLHQKVPPITPGEITRAFTENLRWCRHRWAEQDAMPSDEELFAIVQATQCKPGSR